MTKKGWTRILIVIVAGLWSYNIYRTIQNYQLKTETQELVSTTRMNFSPIVFNKDSFELVLATTDPFLKSNATWKRNNRPTANTPQQLTAQKKTPVPQAEKKPLKWPQITYLGFVKNKDQGRTLCMLNINNKVTRLSEGETAEGIKLIETFRDSVVLELNGVKNTFYKGK